MTFLIIEDSPSMAALLVRQMAKDGHCVTVVGTLADAMQFAASLKPNAILLDLGLPDSPSPEGTLDAIPDLQKAAPEAGIAVLTGYATEAIREKAAIVGAHLVQKKDDTFTDGLDLVKQAIHKKNCTMGDILACSSMLAGIPSESMEETP